MENRPTVMVRIYQDDLIELKRVRKLISDEWEREASLADVIRRLLRTNKKYKIAKRKEIESILETLNA